MTPSERNPSERWFLDQRIGIVSRPEVRFALPLLLEDLGLNPESNPLTPTREAVTARVPMSASDDIYQQSIKRELNDKIYRLLKADAHVIVEMEPDNEHALITLRFDQKDVRP